ncbi:MAG: alanine racemase [Coxiellaceae bacterium]|nr:MAG: alanine racemase [Coxiellaceae bacterium]
MDRVVAEIDLAALRANLAKVKAYAPHSKVLAMVKANAYGHGLVPIATTLAGEQVDGFGVAALDEGITLRQAGIKTRIILMSGVANVDELQIAAAHRFELVIHHPSQIQLLQIASLPTPITIWLKLDTGMHRLGFSPDSFQQAYQALLDCHQVQKPIILMTHLSDADDISNNKTQQQIAMFQSCTAGFPGPKSIANSAAIIAWPEARADWIRPGIMLYGVSPLQNQVAPQLGLAPVMTFRSRIIAVNMIPKGESIGYGSTWQCPENMPIGVVAAGYGDGYPRHAASGTPILVEGVRCPLIGRVSMDLITIDLRNLPQAKLGTPVILWGNGLPVEEIAACAGTIAYELLCSPTQRVKFTYTK